MLILVLIACKKEDDPFSLNISLDSEYYTHGEYPEITTELLYKGKNTIYLHDYPKFFNYVLRETKTNIVYEIPNSIFSAGATHQVSNEKSIKEMEILENRFVPKDELIDDSFSEQLKEDYLPKGTYELTASANFGFSEKEYYLTEKIYFKVN